MANIKGYVTKYESSDGGTGDPAQTFWQFFVEAQSVNTKNRFLAQTVRLAIDTHSQVDVTFDPLKGDTLSQVKIEFKYGCARQLDSCNTNPPSA